MTQYIHNWHRPQQVKAMQTSNSFKNHQHFDIHPNQADTTAIKQLVSDFQLPHAPVFLNQNHGNNVIEFTTQPSIQLASQADACFTRHKHIVCAVMTADCLPILLTDSVGSFVAAVHCGWRSLYANILRETIRKVSSEYPLMAWLGPCIQQQQYEVDESFVSHYLNQKPNSESAFTAINSGKSLANLVEMAQIQLNDLDVSDIEIDGQCTLINPQYYSWRQNKTPRRMASMLWKTT